MMMMVEPFVDEIGGDDDDDSHHPMTDQNNNDDDDDCDEYNIEAELLLQCLLRQ